MNTSRSMLSYWRFLYLKNDFYYYKYFFQNEISEA
jgi:hypothetical protein